MAFRFDASKLPGSRIAGVTVGGAPIEDSRTYQLATNDFLGGDGYDMFADAPQLINAAAGKLMAAQVTDAIAAAGEIAPQVEGRIVPAGQIGRTGEGGKGFAQRAVPDRPRRPLASHSSKLADISECWVAHQSAFVCSAVAMFACAVGSIAFVASSTSDIADILAGP